MKDLWDPSLVLLGHPGDTHSIPRIHEPHTSRHQEPGLWAQHLPVHCRQEKGEGLGMQRRALRAQGCVSPDPGPPEAWIDDTLILELWEPEDGEWCSRVAVRDQVCPRGVLVVRLVRLGFKSDDIKERVTNLS